MLIVVKQLLQIASYRNCGDFRADKPRYDHFTVRRLVHHGPSDIYKTLSLS